jgi:hypothetical protein
LQFQQAGAAVMLVLRAIATTAPIRRNFQLGRNMRFLLLCQRMNGIRELYD